MPGEITPECAIYDELALAYRRLVAGGTEVQIRFGDEEVRYGKADLDRLERLMREYEGKCLVSQGQTPARTRYAKRAGFRPY